MARFLSVLLVGLVCLAGTSRAEEDPLDKAVIVPMVKQTLEFERTGKDTRWSNPETGARGIIRVERTYYRDAKTPCRDYIRTTKRPEGEEVTTRGTGCRMGDGRWFLDEAPAAAAGPAPKAPPAAAGAPAGREKETATTAAPAAPADLAAPKAAAPAGADKPGGTGGDKPAGDAMAEADAPAPARVKPKVLAPDYTMPAKSAL